MTISIVSWNIGRAERAWEWLAADETIDIALLQEVDQGPTIDRYEVVSANEGWELAGWEQRKFCTAVVRCSDRYELKAEPVLKPLGLAGHAELAVSRPGSLAVASLDPGDGGGPIVVVSVYCAWERPVPYKDWIFSDASAHRILSDVSPLLYYTSHRIVVAGDWNMAFGATADPWFTARDKSVSDRADALRFQFVGPQHPNGRQADPWPNELPIGSKNVPTYHHSRQTPETATRQLDFVLASKNFADSVTATALNEPGQWGPSDHCRVRIDIDL